jgi:hypothetical protein
MTEERREAGEHARDEDRSAVARYEQCRQCTRDRGHGRIARVHPHVDRVTLTASAHAGQPLFRSPRRRPSSNDSTAMRA